MSIRKDLWTLSKPYYWLNLLMSFSYVIFKKVPVLCEYFAINQDSKCQLDGRESEILMFSLIVIMIRSRKTGSTTMISYLSNAFMYCKVANMVLWYYADVRAGILFTVLFIVLGIWVPEPTYQGPSNVVYFRTALNLEDEMKRDKHSLWLICFYTVWNPSCTNFAPIFAQLSADYGLKNLKFGKIDVTRCPDVAKKYGISDTAASRQLPTLILFKEGQEIERRPLVDSRGKEMKFFFTEDNVKMAFDLISLHELCKSRLSKKAALEASESKKLA